MMKKLDVALLAYEGVQMSAVLGLVDLFGIANRFSAQLGGVEIRPVQIMQTRLPDQVYQAVILPPSLQAAYGEGALQVHGWLRRQQAGGALMCSVCAGSFWLGYAGLLAGRPATTHWALETDFHQCFPDVALDCAAMLVDDNDVITAGGVMAWVDLGLALIRRWQGEQVVSRTARHFLVDTAGREQANYRSFRPILTHGDKAIRQIQIWLESHSAEQIKQQQLAARAALSLRSFQRRFKRATGLSALEYLQQLRIEKARGLLEHTRLPISEIGWNTGYRDGSAFGRVFKEITGLTAGEYRHRFGVCCR